MPCGPSATAAHQVNALLRPTRMVTMAMTGLPSLFRPNSSCKPLQLALLHRVGIIVLRISGSAAVVKHPRQYRSGYRQLTCFWRSRPSRPWLNHGSWYGRADGGDLISSLDCAFHKVGAAIILHNVGIACRGQVLLQDIHAILAGRQCYGSRSNLSKWRMEPGKRPPVAVDDIRLKVGIEQGFRRRGEESKTLAVIIEATTGPAALKVNIRCR